MTEALGHLRGLTTRGIEIRLDESGSVSASVEVEDAPELPLDAPKVPSE